MSCNRKASIDDIKAYAAKYNMPVDKDSALTAGWFLTMADNSYKQAQIDLIQKLRLQIVVAREYTDNFGTILSAADCDMYLKQLLDELYD